MTKLLSMSGHSLNQYLNESVLSIDVEYISPEKAKLYLAKNFSDNRKFSEKNLRKHVQSMVNGDWTISTDCIGFDNHGRLINGQHRLTAVVQSETTQPFIVVRNLPSSVAQVLDLGKKRMMHERLTIAGNYMNINVCSVVRNTLTNYTSNFVGTVQYTDPNHDNFVYKIYTKHSEFFDLLAEKNLIKPSFFAAAAAKIYAEMPQIAAEHARSKYAPGFVHGMEPLDRAIHFIQLACTGSSPGYYTDPNFDTAAIRLKDLWSTRKAQNKHWSTIHEYRLTISAAYAFMKGKPLKTIKPSQKDPFRLFSSLPSTNKNYA